MSGVWSVMFDSCRIRGLIGRLLGGLDDARGGLANKKLASLGFIGEPALDPLNLDAHPAVFEIGMLRVPNPEKAIVGCFDDLLGGHFDSCRVRSAQSETPIDRPVLSTTDFNSPVDFFGFPHYGLGMIEFEPTMRANLLMLADAFGQITGLKPSTISNRVAGDSRFFENLRKPQPGAFSVRIYDRAVAKFAELWPEGQAMPDLMVPGVDRPPRRRLRR